MEIIFISVDNNHELYHKCVRNNPFITNNNNIKTVVFDNTKENKYISVRYNEFLNSYDYSNSRNSGGAWFVFCHNDWEILEDIEQKLNNLDTNAIYGPIGHRLYKRNENSYVMEWCGQCYERKKDGSNLRLLDAFHKDTGTPADVVDAQCMIVHSSLVEKYNLRFDEQFEYDLYVEDFMLAAKQNHNIPSRILNLKCCHYSELDNLCDRPAYFVQQKKFVKKYNNKEAGILVFYNFDNVCVEQKCLKRTNLTKESVNASKYDYKIDIYDFNSPMSIAFNKIPENSKVLDAGCSVGYFGELLAKYKNCIVTGMDYEEESLKAAEERNCYEELIHIDFNNFEPKDFPHLKEKFDYIVLLDVLEHLINPDAAIKKLGQFLKTGGKFILSIPNIAHASIKSSLLRDDFEYTDVGLLDSTHLRFFTHKTIVDFLSKLYLQIEDTAYTVWNVQGCQPKNYWERLPLFVKKFIKDDPHSFVSQYVLTVSFDKDKTYSHLSDINSRKIQLHKNQYNEHLKKELKRTPLIKRGKKIHKFLNFIKYIKAAVIYKL